MKKTLRSIALAALALPLVASAQFKVETVWANVVKDGTANPIEGLDGGWGKPTASNPGTATVSRFAVGKDGKVYTTSHKDNAIISYDGQSTSIVAKLSPVTVVNWNGSDPVGAPNSRWNGTAITTDDAGHIVFNYCFIKAASVQKWGMVNEDGTVTDVDLTTPLEDIQNPTRLDIISHIVGDVTSEEGGIGYATTTGSSYVLMFHFKGDGSKMTEITAKASAEVEYIKSGAPLIVPSAKYLTVKEILACDAPENEFYAPYGALGANNSQAEDYVGNGLVATIDNGSVSVLSGLGNRQYLASAVFALGGKNYIVREYVDPLVVNTEVFSGWKAVMTFGVFDIETSECVASWMGSEYTNAYGMATLTAEPVDDKTVNIYTWAATGSADAATGTTPGCYAAMVKLTSDDAPVVDNEPGSEANPYLIATAEDLCNAYTKTVEGKLVYFKQTADIDMAGVTDYVALVGFDAVFGKSICYDGDNHVIKNFKPANRIPGTDPNAYYCTSLFGTPSGTIKNLGIVDADVTTDWIEAGILAGFAGTGVHSATSEVIVDNVFVTGKLTNNANAIPYGDQLAGGMFATSGQPLKVSNSYVQVEINGLQYAGGIIAKAADETAVNISNTYTSGSATASKAASLVAGSGTSWPAVITFDNVVAFGEGKASNIETTGVATVVPAGSEEGIKAVQAWTAFNAGKLYNGLPALNWQNVSAAVSEIAVDENAPAEYFNLQGVRVANPENGIFIVRRGNKVTKEIIR